MIGALIGWLLGVVITLSILHTLPGEPGLLAFFLGFILGGLGFALGRYFSERRKWKQ